MPVESLEQDLLSSRAVKGEPSQLPEGRFGILRKIRNAGRLILWSWLFFSSLGLFLLLQLPGDFLSGLVTNLVQDNTPYRMNSESVSLSLFPSPGVRVKGMELTERFGSSDPLALQSLTIRPSLIRMIPWSGTIQPAGSFSAEAFGGEADGSFQLGSGLKMALDASGLALDQIPQLQKLAAIKGTLVSAKLDLEHDGRWNSADGSFTLLGKDLVFDPASLQLPVPLPILSLGPVQAIARTDKGKLKIERFTVGEPGRDLEAQGQGFINLKQPIFYSEMGIELKFKIGEKILKAVPSLEGMLPMVAGKRADGWWGMKLGGTFLSPGMPQPWTN